MVVQRPATGFLDLFGLKSTGESPPIISNELSAVVDAIDLYTADRRRYITAAGTNNFNGVTGTPSLGPQVPAGEMWLVYAMGCQTGFVPAGVTFRASLGVLHRNSNFYTFAESFTQTATDLTRMAKNFERPLILNAGDRIGGVVTSWAGAGSMNTDIWAVYCPLTV